MDKKTAIILAFIIILAALLRFWNLTGPDMIKDDALYSFRALGYFDWIASLDTQTTPVVWFPEAVWWQSLSFHDAPPLVFAVQWFLFQLFGDNLFAARLPFVLAGIISVLMIYFLAKLFSASFVPVPPAKTKSEQRQSRPDLNRNGNLAGLIAAAALAIFNYHIWISRIGLLDGFLVLWIILSLYFFIKAREKPVNYLWWGIVMALGFLTKYTFAFLAPVFLIALLLWQRSAWKQKWFYVGLIAFLILLSPVIVYNLMMIIERGHPDAAISTMIGLSPEDFKGLTRSVNKDFNLIGLSLMLSENWSWGARVLIFFSIAALIYLSIRQKEMREINLMLILGLFSALMVLSLAGGSERYAVILLPFAALILARTLYWFVQKIKKWQKAVLAAVITLIALWEILFSVNSQLAPEPFIESQLFLASERPPWLGYNNLENYVADFFTSHPEHSYILFGKTPQILEFRRQVIENHLAILGSNPKQQENLLVYDERMDWAAGVWIFERRGLYQAQMIPTLSNFIQASEENYLDKFRQFGFKQAVLIIASDALPHNPRTSNKKLTEFAEKLRRDYEPADFIKNHKNEIIFEIYRIPI